MKNIRARIEKLIADAEGRHLIDRLATVPEKREAFKKLADDYHKVRRELEALVVNKTIRTRPVIGAERCQPFFREGLWLPILRCAYID